MQETDTDDIKKLTDLYVSYKGNTPDSITPLAGAGSNRRYYRLEGNGEIVAGTCGDDPAENRAFVTLSHHFSCCSLPVPEVYAVSGDHKAYLQQWCGNKSLFDCLASSRQTGSYSSDDIALLERAMRILARMQYAGGERLDFGVCYPCEAFNRRLVRWDLNYFKYSFLKPSGIEFDESRLQDEFDRLEDYLLDGEREWRTFMHRDFQSRNVMVAEDGLLSVIDFQSGRRGPGVYDVASFLWQAKARYPQELRRHLADVYLDEALASDSRLSGEDFNKALPYFVLFRTLQTLGAYGFRGWVERKPHFLESILPGIGNLAGIFSDSTLSDGRLQKEFPYLASISTELVDKSENIGPVPFEAYATQCGDDVKADTSPDVCRHVIKADENPLTVTVTSFSFKKGIPEDKSGNGGGFVFDCRAPHNPGRYEPYKRLTGLDAPVREFLEKDGEIAPFVENCEALVDASVERYLQRGFTNLAVSFGCTGGQHRSVYSADAVARHINARYGVRVLVNHREQGISMELPPCDADVKFGSFLRMPQKSYLELYPDRQL